MFEIGYNNIWRLKLKITKLLMLVCLTTALFGTNLSASDSRVNLKLMGGMSSSTINLSWAETVKKPMGGLGIEFQLSNHMAVEIDGYYVNKGIRSRFTDYYRKLPELAISGLLRLRMTIKNGYLSIFGGYEVEFPFHYKEKTFVDEKKEKFTAWFSNRIEQFQHGVIVGIQFPYGTSIKFKYYFSEYHNQGYTESDGYQPYAGLKSNVFYFSLNFNLFTPMKVYYDESSRSEYY